MDIFSILTLIGGLAFFLYGMHVMSSGLERLAGGKLEKSLKKITENPIKGLTLGAGITVAIQSSSAMTVMLVGLVNSGIMNISQTTSVILGSNIGTTLTAWLLSLIGIETDNVFIKMLKPENFSLIFALIGIILLMASKKPKKKDVGTIMLAFSVLMFGMKMMSDAVSPLADMPEFTSMLTAFNNPIVGVLIGTVFTGIIQSSAASIGILQALALTGQISYSMAIPIILGQNIGTCVTAMISSIGVNRNAKKVAIIHLAFKIVGAVIFLVLYYGLDAIFHFSFSDTAITAVGIAFVHSIFNLLNTAVLFPFRNAFVRFSNFILKDNNKEKYELIDKRLLATPSIAVGECYNLTAKMSKLAQETILLSIQTVEKYDEKTAQLILDNEDTLDKYEDKLSTYLVQIAPNTLSEEESQRVSQMLHAIGDFERLGDHSVNILKVAQELHDKGLYFTPKAQVELKVLTDALKEILSLTTETYMNHDAALATQVEPLEQVIDDLVALIRDKHIERLKAGESTVEMGFILSDLLTNYERVSDHCSNIAVSIIELSHNSFSTHKYLKNIKLGNSSNFNEVYKEYSAKYSI